MKLRSHLDLESATPAPKEKPGRFSEGVAPLKGLGRIALPLITIGCTDPDKGNSSFDDSADSGTTVTEPTGWVRFIVDTVANPRYFGKTLNDVLPNLTNGATLVVEDGISGAPSTTPSTSASHCGRPGHGPGSGAETGMQDNREGDSAGGNESAPYPCELGPEQIAEIAGLRYQMYTTNSALNSRIPPYVTQWDPQVNSVLRCSNPQNGTCAPEDYTSGTVELNQRAADWITSGQGGILEIHYIGLHQGPNDGYNNVSGINEREADATGTLQRSYDEMAAAVEAYPSPAQFGDANFADGTGTTGADDMNLLANELTDRVAQEQASAQGEHVYSAKYQEVDGFTFNKEGDPLWLIRLAQKYGFVVTIETDHGESFPGFWGIDGAYLGNAGHPHNIGPTNGSNASTYSFFILYLPDGSPQPVFHAQRFTPQQSTLMGYDLLGLDTVEIFGDPAAQSPLQEDYEDLRTTVYGEPLVRNGNSAYPTYYCGPNGNINQASVYLKGAGWGLSDETDAYHTEADIYFVEEDGKLGEAQTSLEGVPQDLVDVLQAVKDPLSEACTF